MGDCECEVVADAGENFQFRFLQVACESRKPENCLSRPAIGANAVYIAVFLRQLAALVFAVVFATSALVMIRLPTTS